MKRPLTWMMSRLFRFFPEIGRKPLIPIYNRYVEFALLRKSRTLDKNRVLSLIGKYLPWNSSLREAEEVRSALYDLNSLGAFAHHDGPKNWDLARALLFILVHGDLDSAVLDVGCGRWGGFLLPSLALFGFKKLHGCDLRLTHDYRRGSIGYHKSDFFAVDFARQSFQFLTALSVVEHGVPISRYLRKAYELLGTGGFLLTSTDYWEEPIATRDMYPVDPKFREERIFSQEDITEVFSEAVSLGFEIYDGLDFKTDEKLVHWKGRSYTFAFFVLRKSPEL